MRAGELSLAVEIPSGFGRQIERGTPVQIGAWIDGAMPTRAETVNGYVQSMHQLWLADMATHRLGLPLVAASKLELRFRYNPDVGSLPAMVPAVLPLLLMMIPVMLAALSVVREKEMGSIINLYVTPVTRSEFLLGKQLPYIDELSRVVRTTDGAKHHGAKPRPTVRRPLPERTIKQDRVDM